MRPRPIAALIVDIVMPALRSIAVTTTLLVFVLAILAVRLGYNFGDLYAEYFPQSRGPNGGLRLPDHVYAGLIGYVVGSAELAILLRRRNPRPSVPPRRRRPRPFGLAAGTFVVPDDFDDPLPEDILQDFEQ
jgi:hypothetical protein